MTTNDQTTAEATNQAPRHTDSTRDDLSFEPNDTPRAEAAPASVPPRRASVDTEPSPEPADSEKPLFGEELLTSLRARWVELQSVFVDDPRDCVQKADGLVADVVGQLESGFAEARSHLERQWSRGEEASTEDLRVALKRYREFFDRLLKV